MGTFVNKRMRMLWASGLSLGIAHLRGYYALAGGEPGVANW